MKVSVTITNVEGKDRIIDMFPEEIHQLQGIMMAMSTGGKDAPACITITRKDVIKKMLKEN